MDPRGRPTPGPDQEKGTGRSLLLVAGLFLLAVVASWSLLGPQREDVSVDGAPARVVDADYYSYAARVPDAPRGIELATGALTFAAAVALANRALRSGDGLASTTPTRVVGTGASLLAGVVVGCGARIVTAGVVGANIGAGLGVLFGLPFAVALVVIAAVIAVRR